MAKFKVGQYHQPGTERVNDDYARGVCSFCAWKSLPVSVRDVEGWAIIDRYRDEHLDVHSLNKTGLKCWCGQPVKRSSDGTCVLSRYCEKHDTQVAAVEAALDA